MELCQRDFFMQRIICGYHRYKPRRGFELLINEPTSEILYDAQDVYLETLGDCLKEGLRSEHEILSFMYDRGLWNDTREHETQELIPKHIENLKVDLYNNSYDEFKVTNIKSAIKEAKIALVELYYKRHAFDYTTAHGVANFMKNYYLTEQLVKFKNGEAYNWEEYNILSLLSYRDRSGITDDEIRDIAKHNEWKSIWYAHKPNGNLFSRLSVNLTQEQKRLIFWSTFYDNIGEHPDAPPEKIIEDNDMIDGWVIIQRRERDKEKSAKDINKKIGSDKMKKAGEIFIIARDEKHAQEIESLNSPQSAARKQARINQLDKKGSMQESEFSDVKGQKAMSALRQGNQIMKNKG